MVRKTREGFPREYRIVRGAEYRAAYEGGLKLYQPHFILFARANSLTHHRLGITVTRKVGGAVVRNRIKRLFREIYRRVASEIPGSFDLVVNARRGAEAAGFSGLREQFLAAAGEAFRRRPLGAPAGIEQPASAKEGGAAP